jgi:hypothetical protein
MMNRLTPLRRATPLLRRTPSPRHVSTTNPLLQALPKPKSSSDDPKTSQSKTGNKTKSAPSSQSKAAAKEAKSNRIQELLVKAYDAPWTKAPVADEEEMARRYRVGREYVIGCWERHNEENHELAVKIRMKRYAIKRLPKEGEIGDSLIEIVGGESGTTKKKKKGKGGDDATNTNNNTSTSVYARWRQEALKIDDMMGPPDWRHIPMLTPPIPDFDASLYMESEEEQ